MSDLIENLKALGGIRKDSIQNKAVERIRELERENAALKAALDHQMSYQRELRADRDRLDWLDKTGCWVTIPGARNYASGSSRAVIDAAMEEAQP